MLLPVSLSSQSLRIGGGLSTTYNNVDALLTSSTYTSGGTARQILSDATFTGYHLGLRYMLPLGSGVGFTAAVGWHRFGTVRLNVVDPVKPTIALSNFEASQTMIPVAGGLELTIFRAGIGLYLMGELSYNYFISNTKNGIPTGIELRDAFSRVGGSAGLGVDMSVGGIGVDVALRYHYANLIGKTSGEPETTFLSLTVALLLGKK